MGVAALLVLVPGYQLPAQVDLHVTIGARHSANLVHDSIVAPFDVRPAVAPTLGFGVQLAPHRGWSAGVAFDISRSQLRRHDADGSAIDLGALGAVSFMVSLRRELGAGLGARLTVGGLRYLPTSETGIFGAGAGDLFPLLGVAFDWAPRAARTRNLGLELRTDAHRFLTRALRDQGFTHRLVPRVALAVRVDVTRSR